MNNPQTWHVVKRNAGHCEVVPSEQVAGEHKSSDIVEQWGAFASQEEAIARRVGLIRSGKCQPQ